MSNSNLHTTAISTGGTSFDTATCIGGKCYYPLIESGNNAKVYTHNMVCTQDQYEKGSLNTTLEPFHATNAPQGSKPTRSPFDDDANAYFVGDFNLNNVGNGMVAFQRVYATIPDPHVEPYGLYSRALPSYSVDAVTIAPTATNSLIIKEQYSSDGINWTTRATADMGDNVIMGTTLDSAGTTTVNDATLDWKDYSYIRCQYECNLESSGTVFEQTPLLIIADYPKHLYRYSSGWTAKVNNVATNASSDIVINCKQSFGYQTYTHQFYDSHRSLGKLSIDSVDTTTTPGEIGIVATTPPFNIAQYHSESNYKDFGGIEMGRHTFFHRAWKWGSVYVTYFDDVQAPSNIDNLRVPRFVRGAGLEVNCAANIEYRYELTDSPENIVLAAAENFPDTLSNSTTPTTAQYLGHVAAGDYFNAENEFIERYMGNIYRMGLIKSTLQ